MRKTTSFEEFETELRADPEYRKAERKIKPYYDLALQIIKRRVSLGLTQNDLARRANTYQSRISKIESSEFDIRLSTLISIAEALDTQVSIKLIPASETYHDKEKLYRQLFKTDSVSQPKSEKVATQGQRYHASLSVIGSS